MNAVVKTQHILQATDWTRFTLEEWLYQFGAWQESVKGTCGRSVNPIAVAMDQAIVKRKQSKLSDAEKSKVIAGYFTTDISDFKKLGRKNKNLVCQIDDNEARAVQRLVLDMYGKSEVLDDWMDAVIDRYFYFNSWSEMVNECRGQRGAEDDVKCGVAALHCRYGFIAHK
jgi:hypothetical protein